MSERSYFLIYIFFYKFVVSYLSYCKRIYTSMNKRRQIWESCMYKLWMIMTDRYGSLWTREHGKTWDMRQWSIDLDGLTAKQFSQGCKLDLERGEKWPPTTSMFVAMAKKPSQPAHQPLPKMLESHPTPGVADKWKAFQQLEGITNNGYTMEEIERILQDDDIGSMRTMIEHNKREIIGR